MVVELELIKEFFMKNLEKGFIKLNIVLYTLLVLFIIKKNRIKCFYIDYYKLNTLTKKNYYFISKINKIL